MSNSSKSTSLASASLAIVTAGILSKLLGFVRTMSIAAVFGTSSDVDAFVVAHNLPGFLFGLIGAAVGTVVIPLFTRKRVNQGEEEAFQMAETIWNVVALAAILVLLIGEIAMPWLIKLVAPGFKGEVYDTTVFLGRLMLPMIIFIGLNGLSTGMLNSLQVFGIPAFAGPLQNILIIISIFTLGKLKGISGVAFGSVIGIASSFFILRYALRNRGFRPKRRIDWHMPELREILILAIPVSIGVGINTINGLVDRILASGLPEGNVSAMDYATRLYTLPWTLVGSALSTVIYPTLAEFAADKEQERMVSGIRRGLSIGFLGILPMSAGILVLAEPLTKVVYERGAFDVTATALTSSILAMYMLGVPAMNWIDIVTKGFYAEGDTRTPLWTSLLSVGTNIVLNFLLVGKLGAIGLALATSASLWVGAIGRMTLWDRKHKKEGCRRVANREFVWETMKVTLAASVMFIAVKFFWVEVAETALGLVPSNLETLYWLVISTVLGAGIYSIMVWLLKVKEFRFLMDMVKKGMRKAFSGVK